MSNVHRGPQFTLNSEIDSEKEIVSFLEQFPLRQRSVEVVKLLKAAVFLAKSNPFLVDLAARDLTSESDISRFDELYNLSNSIISFTGSSNNTKEDDSTAVTGNTDSIDSKRDNSNSSKGGFIKMKG